MVLNTADPGLEAGARLYAEAFNQGLRPDPLLTVSEWADGHRRLSGRAASEPGPWRTNRTPYLQEIMDCLSPASSVERVTYEPIAEWVTGCAQAIVRP